MLTYVWRIKVKGIRNYSSDEAGCDYVARKIEEVHAFPRWNASDPQVTQKWATWGSFLLGSRSILRSVSRATRTLGRDDPFRRTLDRDELVADELIVRATGGVALAKEALGAGDARE